MASRPRATAPRRKSRHKSGDVPLWLTFTAGLVSGLLVAVLYFSVYNDTDDRKGTSVKAERDDKPESGVSPPQFEFYSILPELEVVIPEQFTDSLREILPQDRDENTVAKATPTPKKGPVTPDKSGDIYSIQAGSFKSIEDAERMKVNLLLLGLNVVVKVVSVEGVRYHRVRVGPLTDYRSFQQARDRLKENNIQYMVLKSRS